MDDCSITFGSVADDECYQEWKKKQVVQYRRNRCEKQEMRMHIADQVIWYSLQENISDRVKKNASADPE